MAISPHSTRQALARNIAGARRKLLSSWQFLRMIGRSFTTGHLETTAKNERLLEIEVFWASFLSAAATFNAAFAVRLGASNQEVGLLSSMPALLAFLVTIPAGRYFSRKARWMPLIVQSLFLHRLGFLVIALIPWLPLPARDSILIWTLIAFTVPAHFFGVGWNSMLADAIPEVKRAKVFAMRNIVSAIAVTGGIFAAGQWLEYAPFPINYQMMYMVGFAASMISLYYIAKVRLPDRQRTPPVITETQLQQVSAREWLIRVFGRQGVLRREPDFNRMVINTFLHGLGLWMIGPLYVLYYVRVLDASDGWLGLNGTLANLTPIVGYYLWQRATVRWGENQVLKWSITTIGIYPLLVGTTPDLTMILVWTALYGLLAPGVNLSHFPMLLKVCPADERPLYMGVYTTLMNAGAFIMPMVGVIFADIFGIGPVLIGGGILCLIGSASFVFNPLRTADSMAARNGG
jgi:hypothetical protein